jgi:hypothetical protein
MKLFVPTNILAPHRKKYGIFAIEKKIRETQ